MNDAAIKSFCTSARKELRDQVRARLIEWDITESADPNRNVISERPLSPTQVAQRKALLKLYRAEGEEQLIERAAYTWFNRLMAIRYMEVNDCLPCHCRVLSAADGSFDPQIVKDALTVEVEGADKAEILKLLQANDDEALFRYLFLAVCNDLAACMPDVFEPIGSAMELLLPKGMLHKGSVAARMVTEIPEGDWREGVQIVGWMYQYYVSERKDEVFAGFKKGKKAERYDIAPATQLFTPDWIVKYLVQNSLGRLWMLNNPRSSLASKMEYYIAPGEDAETEFLRIGSPEELTTCDPACGSGHILVYAFDLLALMYEEVGYTRRDIPRIILENNLTGFEIDPRAAAIASFCLTMKGLEYDSRFLRRGVKPRISLLESIEFTEEETASVPVLADNPVLVDALAHLSECGTLFKPTPEDFSTIDAALLQLSGTPNLFIDSLVTKLDQAATICVDLSETHAVVVANPPYMGSSNMNKWLANWTKKNYPDSKRDLCTCFIERGFTLAASDGYSAMVTMESWMFLGSYEKLRQRILDKKTISTLVYMNHMVMRIAFNTSATVFKNAFSNDIGAYTKVEYSDLDERGVPAVFPLERHGVYRRSAETFKSIPGTPIAYWASDALIHAYAPGRLIQDFADLRQGLATGNDDEFVRYWWEVPDGLFLRDGHGSEDVINKKMRWVPLNKGGAFRKWYGNNDVVLAFDNESHKTLKSQGNHLPSEQYYFRPSVTWSKVTAGPISFRYKPWGHAFGVAGGGIYADENTLKVLLGLCNSSVIGTISGILSPTLNYEVGQVASYPSCQVDSYGPAISSEVDDLRNLSKSDWDSLEASWDFQRHPMV